MYFAKLIFLLNQTLVEIEKLTLSSVTGYIMHVIIHMLHIIHAS